MENMDKSKMHISPSKESIMAYVDGEWKQFLRSDVIQELQVKTCNKPAVSKCESIAGGTSVCQGCGRELDQMDNAVGMCYECGLII